MPDDDLKQCPTCGGARKYLNTEGKMVECYTCVGTGWVKK